MGVRCIILNDQQQVLLVKHTYISGWHLPGGGLNPGESVEDGVFREVQEETGLILENKPMLKGVFHNRETTNRDHIVLFFSKTSQTADSLNKSMEIKTVDFFSLKALPEDVDPAAEGWIVSAIQNLGDCNN